MNRPVVLIVEDDPDGRRSVQEAVEDIGLQVIATGTGEEGVSAFREQTCDIVLSDLVLPDIDGIEVLSRILALDRDVPVLIMTAYGTVDSAVDALKAGAYDYITKPLDLDDIQSKVARAVETSRLRREVAQLQKSVRGRYTAASIVAESESMREILRQIESLADTNATVLVQGESGTGKELVARALHVDGSRGGGPFVAVNCGAFTETLLESQLFGHEKGAFTGATGQYKGAFERADGGTLFLDEVGNAPLPVQVKLLRVLEEREVTRVGGEKTFPVDVRVISASNRDIEEMAQEGEFRDDLLYRLKVVTLSMPPLRDRKEDIRPLTDRFVAEACQEHGREIRSIAPECYERLAAYDWPGNVRQLRNVVHASVVMVRRPALGPGDIRIEDAPRRAETEFVIPDGLTLADLEKEALLQLLQRNDGNRTIVAEKLGLSRRTIQRKIKDYDLPF